MLLFLIAIAAQVSLPHQAPKPRISYVIHINSADLSGFDVEMRIRGAGKRVRLAMASHPEYDDRYFRYVENVIAESRGATLKVTREEDGLWLVNAPADEFTVKYRINLPNQTAQPRAAWRPFLTPTGGLVGDLHSLMYVVGEASEQARITLDLPKGWAVASGLDSTSDPRTLSASVELLLDSPIIVGHFKHWHFAVDSVPHSIIYLPQENPASFDEAGFVAGIHRLAKEAVTMFGRPPYRSYTFVYLDGAGGALEHLNSVCIGATSQNLARGLADTFQTTAHEFFHTWNLMKVRPVERVGVSYHHAKPTPVLWWSEGVTMFFSDLLLRRAELPLSDSTRIAYLENRIATYLGVPGYSRISPERASLAADDPLALGDDYASYYLQGQVLGALLDLKIRDATHGRRSLEDVMRTLSERFTPRRGISDDDIERAVRDVCGCDAHTFFESHVRGAERIDLDRYLLAVGLRARVAWAPALNADGTPAPDLRIFTFTTATETTLRIRLLDRASAWGRAGLHTGDRLIAIDGRGVTSAAEFRTWLSQLRVGQTARVEILRDGSPSQVVIPIAGYDRPTARIEEVADATPLQRRLRAEWLASR